MKRFIRMKTRVITHYLEMTDPAEHRPARPAGDLEVRRVEVVCPEVNRFLYSAVGGDWYWIDRLGWTYRKWTEYLSRPELETWIGWSAGTPAGYFELEESPETGVEIAYFGLLPQFVGRGLGAALLSAAVARAWQRGPARVWLHTCSLDHPRALANYQARGFRLYHTTDEEKDTPDAPPGPWPGADKPA
jgi:ribosomal protein S18 acetylase RimI-like enzyme